jgi:transposase
MTGKQGGSPESIAWEIKRHTRRKFTAEEKIRIVLEGLRGEAGIRQLNGDTIREAGSDEVKELRTENDALKMLRS